MLKMRTFWIFLAITIASLAAMIVVGFNSPKTKTAINPVRIVSLSPQLTEILYSLGLADRITAVTADSDYPAQASQKPTVGTFWQPNLEAVISARPDLVVLEKFEQHQNIASRLEQLGYSVVRVRIDTVSELFAGIEKLGTATNKSATASALCDNIKSGLINISGPVSKRSKPRVLWVMQTEPIHVAGRGTFVNEIIELAGGKNAIGPTVQAYPPLGVEKIIACKPDVIIHPAMSGGDLREQQDKALKFWSKWPSIPAVKHNRIYVISPDEVCRLGPRLDKGLINAAKCIHPEVFEDQNDKAAHSTGPHN